MVLIQVDFPSGASGIKNLTANAGEVARDVVHMIPESGRSP